MTVIAAISFAEEIVILSDSRMSYNDKKSPPQDNLKKIYQLTSHSVLTYATDDVLLTGKIIEDITKYISKQKVTTTRKIFEKIIKEANKSYRKRTSGKAKPRMNFIYAGMNDHTIYLSKDKFLKILKLHGDKPYFPAKLKNLNETEKGKYKIPPLNPLLIKQSFPQNKVITSTGFDFTTDGAGLPFISELEQFYTDVFSVPGGFNKSVILRNLCNDYIEDACIDSVGGLVQVFYIDKDGVKPLNFVEHHNNEVVSRLTINDKGEWLEEDNRAGTIRKAIQITQL